uniref:Uncharacterized protein n=1 Tax=Oryza brachyantha TaxID=4533 RepID=J3LSJ9_ORYBR
MHDAHLSTSLYINRCNTEQIDQRRDNRTEERMASMKLPLAAAAVVFLLSGLVAAKSAEAQAAAPCPVVCIQGGYITCDNYPYQKLDGCDCECAPKDGEN